MDSVTQVVPGGTMGFVLTVGSADSVVITSAAQLGGAQWGYAYSAALLATCGTGTFAWMVDSGAPPPGTTLSQAGVLSGASTDTGSYTFRAAVTSGATTDRRAFTVHVTEPPLQIQQVLALGFQGPAGIGDDVRRYLDFQGNRNGAFDIGDVLRWLERKGFVPAATALVRLTASQRVRP